MSCQHALSLGRVPGLEVVHYKGGWPDSEKAFDGVSGIFLYADGGGGHPLIQGNHISIIGDLMGRGVGLMCAHYGVEVPYGQFLGELVNFLIVSFAVFLFIVKFLGWVMKARQQDAPPLTRDQELLTEIRDLLRKEPPARTTL